jgi:hypothetical protein
VVVTAAVVVVDGACVVLVGATVTSTVEAGAAGGTVVAVEAGAGRGVVGGVTPTCGIRELSGTVVIAGWGSGGGAVVAVVGTADVTGVGVVVAASDGPVVRLPSTAPVRDGFPGWPRATSSTRALRQNNASAYTTTFSR